MGEFFGFLGREVGAIQFFHEDMPTPYLFSPWWCCFEAVIQPARGRRRGKKKNCRRIREVGKKFQERSLKAEA
jgi:hypothetical protein